MQMNKPADLELTTKALDERKIKPKQEPLMLKAALLLGLSQTEGAGGPQIEAEIEIPYCNIACMQAIKSNKGIAKLAAFNEGNDSVL
jgi:hypothetical protein